MPRRASGRSRPRTERQLVRPRPPAGGEIGHVRTERWAGRQLDLGSRPDLAELIRAIDGLRTADGTNAIPRLRFITSHPWDLSDRLIDAMADCPSVCEALHLPVQSGDDAVLRRMGRQYTIEHYRERLDRIRDAVPDIAISTDVIVGFVARPRRSTIDPPPAREGPLRPGLRGRLFERPGTPATRLPDDVPADVKRRRLNQLLALQEPIGLERNSAWLGRTVEVLVDAIVPPRSHEHEDADEPISIASRRTGTEPVDPAARAQVRLTGRTRQNKLVHLMGPASWLGSLVDVRIEHAGPYAMRGIPS